MSTPETPAGSRKAKALIFLSVFAAAAAVGVLAMRGGRGVEIERPSPSESTSAPPPPPAVPSGSELEPGVRPTLNGGSKEATATGATVAHVRIHGRVTASEPGPAIVGTVAVRRGVGRKAIVRAQTTLGADGRYEVATDVDPSPERADVDGYRLVADCAEWGPVEMPVALGVAGEYERDLSVGPGRITGRVVDESGAAVAGLDIRVNVWADDPEIDPSMLDGRSDVGRRGAVTRAVTNARGEFDLRGLQAGPHFLVSATPEWMLEWEKVNAGVMDTEVTAYPAVSFTGVVRDARSNEPVEATVHVVRTRAPRDGDVPRDRSRESSVETHQGRFLLADRAPGPDEGARFSLRAIPRSLEFAESGAYGPFERDLRRREVDIRVQRTGSGRLLLDVTTLRGRAFEGALLARLVPRGWEGQPRDSEAVRERPGRYRIEVPADRDWDVLVYMPPPPPEKLEFLFLPPPQVLLPVHVLAGAESTTRAAMPGYGRLRVEHLRDDTHVEVECLGANAGRSITWMLDPDETPSPGRRGRVVPEARYRVSVGGKSTRGSREVEVKADEETVVDFR